MTTRSLLRLMLVEEFRLHTSYSGRKMFLAFPIVIGLFSLAIALTSERLFAYTPVRDAILLLHASVFLYGLSVGAFGFLGRQYLERTNGTRNYIVAMPGMLPMRLRTTFLGMYLRDAVFYVALLLAPATAGLLASVPVTGFRLGSIAVLFAAANLVLTHLLGPRRHGARKDITYESGMNPVGTARKRFNVRFYILAMTFLVFDVEIIFLYPWAVTAGALGTFGLVAMIIFAVIVFISLLYEIAMGGLEWGPRKHHQLQQSADIPTGRTTSGTIRRVSAREEAA